MYFLNIFSSNKKLRNFLNLFSILVLFSFFIAKSDAKPLAKMENIIVTLEEAEFKAKSLGAGNFIDLPKETKEAILTKIIQEKLIEAEAKKTKLDKTAEFEYTMRSLIIFKYLTQNEKEIEEEAFNLYQTSKKELEGKKAYTFSHILLKTEEEAKKMQAEIFAKKNYWKQEFKRQAREKSLDEISAKNNGFVGKIPETMLPLELTNSLSKMKKDLIYGPLQTSYGFHLIWLEAVEDIQIPSFNELKQRFISQIVAQKIEEKGIKLQNNRKIAFN